MADSAQDRWQDIMSTRRGPQPGGPDFDIPVPPRLPVDAKIFAENIGATLSAMTTDELPPEAHLEALAASEKVRGVTGRLARKTFAQLGNTDPYQVRLLTDTETPAEMGRLVEHLGEYPLPLDAEIATSNQGFFQLAVPKRPRPGAFIVASRAWGIFGALADQNVPYFVPEDDARLLGRHSVQMLDEVERTTNRLLASTPNKVSEAKIAQCLGISPAAADQKRQAAGPLAHHRSWEPPPAAAATTSK